MARHDEETLIPFTLAEPKYDQETYWGRFRTIIDASSPRYAFVGKNEVLRQYELVKNQQVRE